MSKAVPARSTALSGRIVRATTAGFLLGAVVPVAAQAGTDTAPIYAAAAATPLSGVEVTGAKQPEAAKRTAPLLDTPKSITVIPETVIRDSGLTSLEAVLRTVPGITFASGEGGTAAGDRPMIRGIDSTNDIFVDGIRDSGVGQREIFAVESVEVIKGPSSAYTGRGSTGGSINILTKRPKADDFATVGAVVGTDETHRVTADLNHAFSDQVAFRVALMAHENEVAGRDAVWGEKWGVAPSITVGLDSPTTATLSYYHLETEDLPDYGIPYNPATLRPVTGVDDKFYGLKSRDFRETTSDIATLQLEHDFGNGLTLANVTRYGKSTNAYVVTNPDDSRGNVANGYVLRNTKNRNTATETWANVTNLRGQFTTGSIKHRVLAGVEFSKEQTHNQGYFVNGPGFAATAGFAPVSAASRIDGTGQCSNPASLGARFGYECTTLANPNPDDPWIGTITRSPAYTDTTTETKAVYLFDTVDFNDQWSLNLGVRYDDFSTKAVGVTATATTTAPYVTLAPTRAANNSDFFSYLAGVVYKPVPEATLYASYATSSNPSGEGGGDFSVVAVTTQNLKPEENRTFEVGAKWNVRESLIVSAAAFRVEKTNARATDAFGVTQLLGETRVDGFELSLSGNVTPEWNVFGGVSILDAKTIDGGYTNVGTTAAPIYAVSAANGKRLPNTAELSATLWTTYTLTKALTVGGGAQYSGDRFGDAANTRKVDAYWNFDAMAAYQVNDKLKLQLNLINLTDERYVTRAYSTHMVQIAAGRSALLSASYSF